MLSLIYLILIVVFSILLYRYEKSSDYNPINESFTSITGVMIFIVTICMIVTVLHCVKSMTINDKIAMYQEENSKIEEQIDGLVTQYMEFEQDTYGDLKSESSIALVSLYPELKSDELVKKQCDTYLENNNKIKELKEDKINYKLSRWWLYFGK